MHDKFRRKYRVASATDRVRGQIAREAARRLWDAVAPRDDGDSLDWLDGTTENDYYVAKRKAAAVLGHRLRPGDLPSDTEVREQIVILWRSRADHRESELSMPEPDEGEVPLSLAQHLDRFAVYRMRLLPLEGVKQVVKHHPEGDALYHSLQVFHLAREARPFDEEFLLAALLHDVGKAIDEKNHCAAAVHALHGAVTERTLWLIEHHMDLLPARERTLSARARRELEESEYIDDLRLLRELDDAGRVPGAVVEPLDEALAYIKGLEHEAYLD